jgi:aspartate-semialdehyde dehydrogenase
VRFRGEEVPIAAASVEALKGVDIALFCASADVARRLALPAVEQGTVVIDNSSAFRMDEDVPLIVPEVNGEAVKGHHGLIANPNCSTAIAVMALAPLEKLAGLRRVVVSTYQAASGAGAEAVEELRAEVRASVSGEDYVPAILPVAGATKHYPLAFNVIPQVDTFEPDGYTHEETKMINESRKILGLPELRITATTVRVPVYYCHSESINITLQRSVTMDEVRKALANWPGVHVVDDPGNQVYPMPIMYGESEDVYVGRLRPDPSWENSMNLWVVGNQLRKGAASNAIQIAEYITQHDLMKW